MGRTKEEDDDGKGRWRKREDERSLMMVTGDRSDIIHLTSPKNLGLRVRLVFSLGLIATQALFLFTAVFSLVPSCCAISGPDPRT